MITAAWCLNVVKVYVEPCSKNKAQEPKLFLFMQRPTQDEPPTKRAKYVPQEDMDNVQQQGPSDNKLATVEKTAGDSCGSDAEESAQTSSPKETCNNEENITLKFETLSGKGEDTEAQTKAEDVPIPQSSEGDNSGAEDNTNSNKQT